METALISFLQKYLGKVNTGNTPENMGQCVGLIEVWIAAQNHPHIPGNAVDLLNNADLTHYQLFRNNPTNFPPPGAIVCWDGSWGAGYGHTAIVIAATSMQVAVFEQNDPEGAAPVLATHSYGGVAGWLVLK